MQQPEHSTHSQLRAQLVELRQAAAIHRDRIAVTLTAIETLQGRIQSLDVDRAPPAATETPPSDLLGEKEPRA